MNALQIARARCNVALAHLAAAIASLKVASDLRTPFPYGDDVRENHRQRRTGDVAHWAARLDEAHKLLSAALDA